MHVDYAATEEITRDYKLKWLRSPVCVLAGSHQSYVGTGIWGCARAHKKTDLQGKPISSFVSSITSLNSVYNWFSLLCERMLVIWNKVTLGINNSWQRADLKSSSMHKMEWNSFKVTRKNYVVIHHEPILVYPLHVFSILTESFWFRKKKRS